MRLIFLFLKLVFPNFMLLEVDQLCDISCGFCLSDCPGDPACHRLAWKTTSPRRSWGTSSGTCREQFLYRPVQVVISLSVNTGGTFKAHQERIGCCDLIKLLSGLSPVKEVCWINSCDELSAQLELADEVTAFKWTNRTLVEIYRFPFISIDAVLTLRRNLLIQQRENMVKLIVSLYIYVKNSFFMIFSQAFGLILGLNLCVIMLFLFNSDFEGGFFI